MVGSRAISIVLIVLLLSTFFVIGSLPYKPAQGQIVKKFDVKNKTTGDDLIHFIPLHFWNTPSGFVASNQRNFTTISYSDRFGREDNNDDMNVFIRIVNIDEENYLSAAELGSDSIVINNTILQHSKELSIPSQSSSIANIPQKVRDSLDASAGFADIEVPKPVTNFLNNNLDLVNTFTNEHLTHYVLLHSVSDEFGKKVLGIQDQFVTTIAFDDRYGKSISSHNLNVVIQFSHTKDRVNSLRAIQLGHDQIKAFVNGQDKGIITQAVLIGGNARSITGSSNFSYTIDPTVKPSQSQVDQTEGSAIPLGAMEDDKGRITSFATNEVIYTPQNVTSLNDFVSKYHGIIIDNSSMIPQTPSALRSTQQRTISHPTFYLIRIDPSSLSLDSLNDSAAKLNINGQLKFSSDSAARLFAMTAKEQAVGNLVTLNFAPHPDSAGQPLTRTFEGTFDDFDGNAIPLPQFNSYYSVDEVCSAAKGCVDYARPSVIPPGKAWTSSNPIFEGSPFSYQKTLSTVPVSDVYKAWQFVKEFNKAILHHPSSHDQDVLVGIIDGGFWLDSNGDPNNINGGSDLATNIVSSDKVNLIPGSDGPDVVVDPTNNNPGMPQCNFENVNLGSYPSAIGCSPASGPNPMMCNNNPCRWHGFGVASTAVGTVNNGIGAAGTGGQVSKPILAKSRLEFGTIKAVDYASFSGADIISMSISLEVPGICYDPGFWGTVADIASLGLSDYYACHGPFKSVLSDAANNGILVLSSAGNNGEDVQNNVFPCIDGNVLCVGALDDDPEHTPYQGTSDPKFPGHYPLPQPRLYHSGSWNSNYGGSVRIYAPTNILVPDIADDGTFTGKLKAFGGTSASAPFVAGIAAMMKHVNHSLSGNQILDILLSTARDGHGFAIKYVDAYDALVAAAGGYHIPPEIYALTDEFGNSVCNEKPVVTPYPSVGCVFKNDGKPGIFIAKILDVQNGDVADANVQWTSDDGQLSGTAHRIAYDYRTSSEGFRLVTVTARSDVDPSLTNQFQFVVDVKLPHIPPSPVIITPTEGMNVGVGTSITLKGRASYTDPYTLVQSWLPCTNLVFVLPSTNLQLPTSEAPSYSQDGMCQAQTTFNKVGQAMVSLVGKNRFGETGSTQVTVNVVNGPSADFSLSTPQQDWGILWGSTITIPINVDGGSSGQPFTFSMQGLPKGATNSFQCGSNTCASPPFTENSVISIDPNDPNCCPAENRYQITITASNGQFSHDISFGLLVRQPPR